MNETVNLWKLFFCCMVLGFQDPRAQTGSNETLRQTKYCQTERHLNEYVSVKKQNIILFTSDNVFPLNHRKNINLPETHRILFLFKYRAHHELFVLTFFSQLNTLVEKST